MRQTIIPAQITTVEDKIAGNFSLTQIMLLLLPLFIATFIYASLPVRFEFTLYKLILMFLAFVICGMLALRVKGKVVFQWLIILLRYNLRPRYYVFNKNDSTERTIVFPFKVAKKKAILEKQLLSKESSKLTRLKVADLVHIERVLHDPRIILSFKFARKGGMDVDISQVKH